jgi:peptidoglycan/xylan/chitin deacetylase (PgdA/CDA1 family)
MRAILTYHSIDPSGSPISVHPEAFDRHVAWLTSGRVTVTTIDRLLSLPSSVDAVAITFDDAFVNFGETAAPRLLTHDLPVTLFVVSDRVGTTNAWAGRPDHGIPHLPLLDWSALARLQARGVLLGAHSRTHPDLTALGPAAVEDEICGSAELIERATGSRPTAFAYPYGRTDDRTARIAAGAYRCACTTEFRALDDGAADARLPRLDMYYFQRRGRIESWGSPDLARFISARRRLRRVRQWVMERGAFR